LRFDKIKLSSLNKIKNIPQQVKKQINVATAFVSLQIDCSRESAALTFLPEKFDIKLQHCKLATIDINDC
jgi:uncharacterized protein HemY